MAQAVVWYNLYSCSPSVDQQPVRLLTSVIKLSCSVEITDNKKQK